jgi:hypothetical protein
MNYVCKHPEESVSVQIDEILDAVRLALSMLVIDLNTDKDGE